MNVYWKDTLTAEERSRLALENALAVLRSRHETLGGAYRDACSELERLRKENEAYRARLHAISVLCEARV